MKSHRSHFWLNLSFVCFALVALPRVHAQVPKNVQMSQAAATRGQIVEDLKFGTGRTGSFLSGSTLLIAGTLSGTPTGGTLNLSNVTLTLPSTFLTAAQLVANNGSGPNAVNGLVHWSEIVGMPAGFADGTDDGSGGSPTTNASELTSGTLGAGRLPQFIGGNVTSSAAGTGALNIVASGVTAGTFGNSTRSVSITVLSDGRVSNVTESVISGGGNISGSISSTGNIITSNGGGGVADSATPLTSVALKNPTQTDLATGTTLTAGVEYYDTIAANRTITISGTTDGTHTSVTWNVTTECVLTYPASYRVGEASTSTTITLPVGIHYTRWDRSNSRWIFSDSAGTIRSLGNQTATLASFLPIGNNTADGKSTVGSILDLGAAHITVGSNTVTANTTANITIVSANNSTATVTANTANNTITLNVTSSGSASFDTGMTMFIPASGTYSTPPSGWSLTGVNGIPALTTPDADYQAIVKTAGTVADPTFSPAAGSYASNQTVTISTATSGASIKYTTNGTDASRSVGTAYSTPITISSNQTVKALAYKDYYVDSAVASAAYVITAGGGPSLVVSTSAGSTGGGGFTTSSVTTTGADFIAICVTWYGGGARPLTDSKGNTWTATTARAVGSTFSVQWYYAYAPTVGTGHTFDIGGSGHYAALAVLAFSGVASSPFDTEATANASSWTTLNSGSLTPGQANVLSLTGIEYDTGSGTLTVPTGYTAGPNVADSSGNNVGAAVAWKVLSSTSTINPAWTSSSAYTNGVASHVTFKY